MPGHDRAAGSRLPSTLVNRTGVGGAAADRAAQQRGAVEGADTVAVAGGLEGAGVGAAPLREVGERLADRLVEPLERGVVEAAGRAGRVEAGLEEGLVDDQIPEPGDLRLVLRPGLEGDAALPQHLPQPGQAEADGVGPELVGLGVELGAAEAAGVADPEVAAVGEADDEPVPG